MLWQTIEHAFINKRKDYYKQCPKSLFKDFKGRKKNKIKEHSKRGTIADLALSYMQL